MMSRTKIFTLSIFWFIWMIFIVFITYTSLSIYKSSVDSKTNLIIASWSVEATSTNDSIDLVAGEEESATYELTVENESDVKVIYSIELSDLPDDIKVKIDDGEYITESDNKITFSEIGVLDYTDTKTHTLTFNAPLTSEEIEDKDISINVTFTQN